MKHHLFPLLLLCAAVPLAACSTPPATDSKAPASESTATPTAASGTTAGKTPIYGNLGNHHFPITTKSTEAQKYFDQGFTLSYAFNHAEGIRSFKQALALDPSCAMCQWAIAFALGPNINAPLAEDAAKEAHAAIEAARGLESGATERERAYIDALAKRFSADPKAERAPLDRAYADAMREVVKKYPDDLDAATLFAQSLMDTSPWNYWNLDGSPRTYTNEVVATLESVLKRKPDHMGAIHMYIHAVEASPHPERALAYADRLPSLAPAAGHIVHMPAHIYLRTSRYHDASTANENAMKADTAYFAGDRVPNNMMYEIGYRPHNAHFLVTSATLEGRRGDALRAADEVKKLMPPEMTHDPAMGGMVQHMQLTPLFVKLRFGMWSDVLAEPAPPAGMPYMSVMWHTAQGIAHAALGHVDEAKKNLAEVTRLKDDPSFKTLGVSPINPAPPIVGIAHALLAAEIATAQKQTPAAIKHFAAAVKLEDGLTYTEPPDWPIPVRQLQGVAMLQLGRYKEAETAFRGDMKKFPDNGWSLSGLAEALEKQGKTADAAAAKARLSEMWKAADVPIDGATAR